MEKKIIREESARVQYSNEKEAEKAKRRFTITIIDNEKREEIIHAQTDLITGIYHDIEESDKECDSMACMNIGCCSVKTQTRAIKSLEELLLTCKKSIVEDNMPEIIRSILNSFMGGGKNE